MGQGIRSATLEDLDHLVIMAEVFNDKYVDFPLNPDKAYTSLRHLIEHPNGILLISAGGLIAGAIHEDPFRDRTMLLETGWYAEEQGRDGLTLLFKFIAEGRKRNVDAIILSTLTTSSDRTRKLLEKLGFVNTEQTYSLEL